jgi:hypothetical protein
MESYGNVFVNPLYNTNVYRWTRSPLIGLPPTPAGLGIDYNTFYGSTDGDNGNNPLFIVEEDGVINLHYSTIADLYAAWGYEQHSQILPYGSQPTMSVCMPNTHEPFEMFPTPRAFIYVFNFQGQPSCSVDIGSCLSIGDTYGIYDWGQYELDNPTPIATAVYTGGPLAIPLTTQYQPVIVANQTARAQHDAVPTLNVGSGSVPGAYILAKIPVSMYDTVPSTEYNRRDRSVGLLGERNLRFLF